ncbi:MAG: DUF4147 domain-containing protein, partial [Chloroflexi bacterium]|nr:DUF4147 domain-containing protein [Chloroflexota bacterium]
MTTPSNGDARLLAMRLLAPALAAVSPQALLRAALRWDGYTLHAGGQQYDLDRIERAVVVGAGKASGGLAAALEEMLGPRIAAGLVVVPSGGEGAPRRIRLQEAAHPVP